MVSVGPAGSQRVPAPLGVQPLGKDWLRSSWSASLGREDPLEKGMATHSSILDWRIHGQRGLADYSLWGCKELDMTE